MNCTYFLGLVTRPDWDRWRVKELVSRGGSRGLEETEANSGRERSDGGLFLPLSFLVFLVLVEGDTQ